MSSQSGRVVQVSISNPGGVPKLPVARAWVGMLGLEGDAHKAAPHIHGGPDRAVCLYCVEAIARVKADGHEAFPGAQGENLTLEGIDWGALRPGDRFEIGEDGLVLELTDPTAPCKNNARWFIGGDFSRISPKLYPQDSRWYARVLAEGAVQPGDRLLVTPRSRVRPVAGDAVAGEQPRTGSREGSPDDQTGSGHVDSGRASQGVSPSMSHDPSPAPLPSTRAELLALHAAARRRRNAAPLGSEEHKRAIEEVGRIEVEIARVERSAEPPRV